MRPSGELHGAAAPPGPNRITKLHDFREAKPTTQVEDITQWLHTLDGPSIMILYIYI